MLAVSGFLHRSDRTAKLNTLPSAAVMYAAAYHPAF